MTDRSHDYSRFSAMFDVQSNSRKSTIQKIESIANSIKATVAIVAALCNLFVFANMSSKLDDVADAVKKASEVSAKETKVTQEAIEVFKETYRVQRAADMFIYQQAFNQLGRTDSILWVMTQKKVK